LLDVQRLINERLQQHAAPPHPSVLSSTTYGTAESLLTSVLTDEGDENGCAIPDRVVRVALERSQLRADDLIQSLRRMALEGSVRWSGEPQSLVCLVRE
jgi:hypothetical protein